MNNLSIFDLNIRCYAKKSPWGVHLHVTSHRLSAACARHNIVRCVHFWVAAHRRQLVPESAALGNMEFGKGNTPGSMNSLFSDFFKDFWKGTLRGVRDYLGEVLGGF